MEKEHLEILLENIDSKLDLVVEGHQVLDKKIEDSGNEFIQKIKDTHDFMHVMYNNLDTKIDQTAERLDKKIDATKEELKEDIKRLENKVDTIKTAYDDHEERITALELRRAKPGN